MLQVHYTRSPRVLRLRRSHLVWVLLTVAVGVFPSGCAVFNPPRLVPTPADSAMARQVLQEVLIEYWREALGHRYDVALANGLPVTLLPDLSQEGRKGELRLAQRVGRGLDQLDVSALSQGDYLTTLVLRWETEARAEASAFYWPDYSLLSPATTPIRDLMGVYRLHPLATTADVERYLFFVEAFPFVAERIQAGLEERKARGYVAPREMVESAVSFYRGMAVLGTDGPWRPSSERLVALDSGVRAAFLSEVESLASLRLVPALDSLATYLGESYLPAASERPGLWQYPGGKELYRHLLRHESSLDVPPEEAHRVGLAELQRIDATMAALRRKQRWNPDALAFHDSLRLAIGEASSLDDVATALVARQAPLVPALAASFASRPAYDATVRRAAPAEALLWPDGAYLPANVVDTIGTLLLTERWRRPAVRGVLASTSYRLLMPGRHFEAALIGGSAAITPLRRFTRTPGFSDGWAQYAASLAGELGLYADPLDAYGRLLDEGASVALLVVDTGIHYLGWSLPQARAVLGRYVLATGAEVDTMLVERVVNRPGRAGAGALGAREVAAMREWMQREQGDEFSLRAWHGEMLSLGALPLPIVGSHLEWWLYDTARRKAEARAAAEKAAREKAPEAKAPEAKAPEAKAPQAKDDTARAPAS